MMKKEEKINIGYIVLAVLVIGVVIFLNVAGRRVQYNWGTKPFVEETIERVLQEKGLIE